MVIIGLLIVIGVILVFIYVGGWFKVCFVLNEKLSFFIFKFVKENFFFNLLDLINFYLFYLINLILV